MLKLEQEGEGNTDMWGYWECWDRGLPPCWSSITIVLTPVCLLWKQDHRQDVNGRVREEPFKIKVRLYSSCSSDLIRNVSSRGKKTASFVKMSVV